MLRAIRILCAISALALAQGHERPPLTLWVRPTCGSREWSGVATAGLLPSLEAAQTELRASLREDPQRDVVVELLAGTHRVPAGGLLLTSEDSSAGNVNRNPSSSQAASPFVLIIRAPGPF